MTKALVVAPPPALARTAPRPDRAAAALDAVTTLLDEAASGRVSPRQVRRLQRVLTSAEGIATTIFGIAEEGNRMAAEAAECGRRIAQCDADVAAFQAAEAQSGTPGLIACACDETCANEHEKHGDHAKCTCASGGGSPYCRCSCPSPTALSKMLKSVRLSGLVSEERNVPTTRPTGVRYVTKEEVERFFAAIPRENIRDRLLFDLVYRHGLRRREVALISIDDISLRDGSIWISRVKQGIPGAYQLHPTTIRLLRVYLPTLDLGRGRFLFRAFDVPPRPSRHRSSTTYSSATRQRRTFPKVGGTSTSSGTASPCIS